MNGKTEIINKWIEKADHDIGTAELIMQYIPEYRDTISFHCQQAVEKYLKAYLIFIDLEVVRSHNLILVLDMISQKQNISDELYDQATILQQFAVDVRYPEVTLDLSDFDIKNAIEIARLIRIHFIDLISQSF